MNTGFSGLLNAFRWLSAFLVVLNHIRHLVFVDYKDVINKNLLIKGFYFISGLGHEAVVVFFVISGFLVGGLTVRKWITKISYKDYFVARFSRIYSVLVPALLLGAGLDWIGSEFFNLSEIYTNSAKYHTISMGFISVRQLNIFVFFGNLMNLQGVVVPVFGSNGPLWSLAYEWWYYLIFAGILGFLFDKNIFIKIAALLCLLVISVSLPTDLIVWMLIWLLGVGVYLYGESSLPKPPRYIAFVLFFIALIFTRISHNTENVLEPESMLTAFLRDFCFGLSLSILLLSLYNFDYKFKYNSAHKFLADFSYSIYLFHFPFFVFVMAFSHDILNVLFLRQPDLIGLTHLIIICVVIYIYGYLMSCITEKHSGIIRAVIRSKIIR